MAVRTQRATRAPSPSGSYPRVNIELIQDYADAEPLSKGRTKNDPVWLVRLHMDIPVGSKAEFDAIVQDLADGLRTNAKQKVKAAAGPEDANDPKKVRAHKFIAAAFD